jgi:hypothetical protein
MYSGYLFVKIGPALSVQAIQQQLQAQRQVPPQKGRLVYVPSLILTTDCLSPLSTRAKVGEPEKRQLSSL